MSDKKTESVLATFFIVVIAIILLLWFRSEEAKVKRIEELEDQIAAYEDEIIDLHNQIEELNDTISWYEDNR